MLSITIQAIVVLVMVAIVFRLVLNDQINYRSQSYKTIPCYLALFALAEIFEFLMAFDALRLRNIIQLFGILLFHAALVVMAALQVRQTHMALIHCDSEYGLCSEPQYSLWKKVEPLLIVVPCTLAASWLIILFCIRKLYDEFGWAIFHLVGANPNLKAKYQYYQIMVCLLKFDFFAFSGVTMQLLIIVLTDDTTEFDLTIVAVPVVLVLLAFCGLALTREIKWLMSISLVLMLASMIYFIYKLVRFYERSSNPFITTRATLTMFTISTLVLLLLTFAIGVRCFSDFGQGLLVAKTDDVTLGALHSPGLPSPGRGVPERQSSYFGGSHLGPRISIE